MSVFYPVIFTATHDEFDTYLIYIPDLQGTTEGYGLEDAIRMARDYIGCRLFDKAEEDIPEATDISKVDVSTGEFADAGESFIAMVDLDLESFRRMMSKKSVRRNVSIPEWLDEAANRSHINVSKVLQDALMDRLGIRQ